MHDKRFHEKDGLEEFLHMRKESKKNGGKKWFYGAAGVMLAGSILVSGSNFVYAAKEQQTGPVSGVSNILSAYLEESQAAAIPRAADIMGASAAGRETAGVEAHEVPISKSEYTDVAIAQVNSYVNVRSEPNTESEILGKLYDNSAATVLETTEDGGWYRIQSGNVNGYVKAEYVVVGNEGLARAVSTRYATVTTTTLYVRKEPTTESPVITMLPEGDDFVVLDESMEGWIRVSTEEGDGYIAREYVTLSTDYVVAESKEEEEARLAKEEAQRQAAAEAAEAARRQREEQERADAARRASRTGRNSNSTQSLGSNSGQSGSSGGGSSSQSVSNGQAVVNYASQFVGNPYVYGGTSLTNGADCSGFIMSVYAAFGVSLPHSSAALRSVGYEVSIDNIQPGDIVCYSGHVGIYAGNNTLLHASSPKTGIKYTSPITYRPILAIRRIF